MQGDSAGYEEAAWHAGDVKTLAFSNFSHALVGQSSGQGNGAGQGYQRIIVDHSKQVCPYAGSMSCMQRITSGYESA
jgi:hypothetical protein